MKAGRTSIGFELVLENCRRMKAQGASSRLEPSGTAIGYLNTFYLESRILKTRYGQNWYVSNVVMEWHRLCRILSVVYIPFGL